MTQQQVPDGWGERFEYIATHPEAIPTKISASYVNMYRNEGWKVTRYTIWQSPGKELK